MKSESGFSFAIASQPLTDGGVYERILF